MAMNVQLVLHALVLVHVLRLVYAEIFHFNVGHWRGVSVPCDFKMLDGLVLPTLQHLSPHKLSESPVYLLAIYGIVKHCHSSNGKESDACCATN